MLALFECKFLLLSMRYQDQKEIFHCKVPINKRNSLKYLSHKVSISSYTREIFKFFKYAGITI